MPRPTSRIMLFAAAAISVPVLTSSPARAESITLSVYAQGNGGGATNGHDYKIVDAGPGVSNSASVSASGKGVNTASVSLSATTSSPSPRAGQISFAGSIDIHNEAPSQGLANAAFGNLNIARYTIVDGGQTRHKLYVSYGGQDTIGGSAQIRAGSSIVNTGLSSQGSFVQDARTDVANEEIAVLLGNFGALKSGDFNFTVIAGVDGLPGRKVEDALQPEPPKSGRWRSNIPIENTPKPSDGTNYKDRAPADVTGAYFTAPTSSNEFTYIDPEPAVGYLYSAAGSRFTEFTIPGALPGGDTSLQLNFNGLLFDYRAGDIFDFTTYSPGGVYWFYLLGIDASAGADVTTHAPFVSGLKFAEDGVSGVYMTPLVRGAAVPEPSSIVMLGAGALGLMVYGRRRSYHG